MSFIPRKIRPAFVTAPAEQPVPDEVRIADLDRQLAAVSEALRTVRVEGLLARADGLLDQRNAIRPAKPRPVPVIPGRVESIIDNYWENP